MEQLESLVAAAQQLVAKQTNKYTQQLEKLSLADRVILELVEENDALITALTDLQVNLNNNSSVVNFLRKSDIHQSKF